MGDRYFCIYCMHCLRVSEQRRRTAIVVFFIHFPGVRLCAVQIPCTISQSLMM